VGSESVGVLGFFRFFREFETVQNDGGKHTGFPMKDFERDKEARLPEKGIL